MKQLWLFTLLFVSTSIQAFQCAEAPSSDVVGLVSLATDVGEIAQEIDQREKYCRGMAACGGQPPCAADADPSCMKNYIKIGCDYGNNYINSGMKRCGLSKEELGAIRFYTASGYGCLNSYLRNPKDRNPDIALLAEVLNEGLAKLPNYDGFVVRGASLPPEIREQHKVGEIVIYPAYTSTSTTNGFGGSDVFMIQSRQGKPVMGFSYYSSENEVLFAPATKFKVLDRFEQHGVNYYVLKEEGGEEPVETAAPAAEEQNVESETITEKKGLRKFLERLGFGRKDSGMPHGQRWECDEADEAPAVIKQDKKPHFPTHQ